MTVTINVERVPEIIWQLRREMAAALRDVASSEKDPRVIHRLMEVALNFEAGQ